ncbi:DinB family protein [Kineococcus gynurae]|uniref:DinB family protein n=1 Tax=Kineococcus gynurae TaxID=452979 RepID=A0ABV5LPC9_9ACTN
MSTLDVNALLREQWEEHWTGQVRPRLVGLTDEEYFWEPVPGCWNVRPRGTSTAALQGGSGTMTIDFAFDAPSPEPVTTIAWRLGHLLVAVLGARNAAHFGGPPTDYLGYDYPTGAADALDRLDAATAAWSAGVASLGEEGLSRPCGPAEGDLAGRPFAHLVLLVHRELLHHLAEVCLLRDLHHHGRGEGVRR